MAVCLPKNCVFVFVFVFVCVTVSAGCICGATLHEQILEVCFSGCCAIESDHYPKVAGNKRTHTYTHVDTR